MEKVSVIIPVYNSEKYLEEMLESVISQTLTDIEIICVDDNSNDGSRGILERYAKLDSRIQILGCHGKSLGAARARNIGLEQARGNYLSILDSDDFFEKDMLELAYNQAISDDADVVIFDGYYFNNDLQVDEYTDVMIHREVVGDKKLVFQNDVREKRFQITNGSAWNKLYKTSFIKENQIKFRETELLDDIEFNYISLAYADRISILKKRLLHYRYNADNNQTQRFNDKIHVFYDAFRGIKDTLIERNLYLKYRITYVNLMVKFAFDKLMGLKDFLLFKKLFYELKEWQLETLGAFEINNQDVQIDYLRKFLNDIFNSEDLDEFLFIFFLKPINKKHELSFSFKKSEKVILYGHKLGVQIKKRLTENQDVKVLGIADKEAECMIRPSDIPAMDYDYIAVTVEKRYTYEEIRDELLQLGCPNKKIIWLTESL